MARPGAKIFEVSEIGAWNICAAEKRAGVQQMLMLK